jgi:DNA-directed RNA polymerase subunit RPC12/RpoP
MAFISAKCPECGGSIQLDDAKESGFCLYCGTKVLLSESIPQIVKVEGIQTLENKLSNAETYAKLGEVEKAISLLSQITEDFTSDYRAWWMLAKVKYAHDFFYRNLHVEYVDRIKTCKEYLYTLNLSPESKKEIILNEYNEYKEMTAKNKEKSQRKIAAIKSGDYSLINHSLYVNLETGIEQGFEVISGMLFKWKKSSNVPVQDGDIVYADEKNLNITCIDEEYITIDDTRKYKILGQMHPALKSYFLNKARLRQEEKSLAQNKQKQDKKELKTMYTIGSILIVVLIILAIIYIQNVQNYT